MNTPDLGGINLILLYPLIAIYKALVFLNFPHPLGISIILLTILIRIVLYPLISSQLKASRKMQELNPKLSEIREKHKGNSTMISQETMKLYKEHGINPAAGCLPVLIQLPIIWVLYSVLQNIVKAPNLVTFEINKVISLDFLRLGSPLDQSFFFFPLGKTPSDLLPSMGLWALSIPLITAALQYVQSKMMFPPPAPQAAGAPKKDDFASVFASQSTYIFPIMIGFFSYTFPFGLSLYWNTFTLFGIIQQYRITGSFNLPKLWLKK